MHGTGWMVFTDGKIYEGKFLHDKKNGKGKIFYKDGKEMNGLWVDSVF